MARNRAITKTITLYEENLEAIEAQRFNFSEFVRWAVATKLQDYLNERK